MIGYVYLTTNLINGKKYIGLKTSNIFLENYFGSGKLIRLALKKYGEENFKVEILEECDTIEELRECERKWIKKFDAQKSSEFYNIAEGGQWGNCIIGMSEEQLKEYKQHLSEGVKQSYINNPDLRVQRRIQRQNMKGKIEVTPEQCKAISIRNKKMWEERKEELTQILRENIEKHKKEGVYKETWKKHTHPWIGRKHTEATKKKISEHTNNHGVNNPNRKKGKVLFCNNVVLNFELTKEAHQFLEEKGFTRRERYRMIKGEIIRNYKIQREDATTIESVNE